MNVRRQGHLAQLIQNFLKDPLVRKADQAVALFHDVHHFPGQKALAKGNPGSHAAFFPGFYQSFPDVVASAL